MSPPILITGCAKSGTTLLFRLFHAFKGLTPLYGDRGDSEVDFHRLISKTRNNPKRTFIGKRLGGCVFSGALGNAPLEAQVADLRAGGVRCVNIIRDGRDVVTSDRNYVPHARWVASMKHRALFPDLIVAEVRYEDLVQDADAVQTVLGAALGLTAKALFSEFPAFLPAAAKKRPRGSSDAYLLRPIDTASIRARPERSGATNAFRHQLQLAGYTGWDAGHWGFVLPKK